MCVRMGVGVGGGGGGWRAPPVSPRRPCPLQFLSDVSLTGLALGGFYFFFWFFFKKAIKNAAGFSAN